MFAMRANSTHLVPTSGDLFSNIELSETKGNHQVQGTPPLVNSTPSKKYI